VASAKEVMPLELTVAVSPFRVSGGGTKKPPAKRGGTKHVYGNGRIEKGDL
jgi:hypothetical protein